MILKILKNKNIKKFIKFINDSPANFANSNAHFEISNNKEIKIEGCRKILEFSKEQIKISTRGMSVNLIGRNLTIKCLNIDSLLIRGFINLIEFNT